MEIEKNYNIEEPTIQKNKYNWRASVKMTSVNDFCEVAQGDHHIQRLARICQQENEDEEAQDPILLLFDNCGAHPDL